MKTYSKLLCKKCTPGPNPSENVSLISVQFDTEPANLEEESIKRKNSNGLKSNLNKISRYSVQTSMK